MLCDVMIEAQAWETTEIEALSEKAALVVLGHLGLTPTDFEIAVLACDDSRIAELNAEFREKGGPTNVLSWPDQDLANPGKAPTLPDVTNGPFGQSLGDIAISFDTCAREAQEARKPFEAHVTHLIVHGCLHLLGYDHVLDTDAARMEGLETTILAKLGIPDPYRT